MLDNESITIKAYTTNETKLTDNTVSLEIGMADVAVGNMYLSGNSSAATLKGEIQNLGCKSASDVTVTVYDANEEGTVIGTADLGTIAKSGAKAFEVSIPKAYLDVNPLVSGNALYVAASTSVDEIDYANNADTYLIKSPADDPLVMNFDEVTLGSDGSESLEVTYSPVVDVAGETVTWTSSDESVVTVKDGKLTAVGTGEATVTAAIKGYTVSCVIKVNNHIAVTGIYLEESGVNILAGQTKQLTANVLPANATNKKVTWESSDKEIATVSSSGLVQAVAVGTTEITAYTDDGYKMASCKVTVSQDAETVHKVTFSGGTGASGKRPAALSGTAGTLVVLPQNPYKKEGYHFVGWTDGNNTYEENASYRIPYRDVVMTASWASDGKQEYIISATCQAGGSITPKGDVAVTEGEAQKFTIAASDGYSIGDVKVDGESVGAVSEYTFEDVSASHTIEAMFNKNTSVKIEKIQLSQTEATLGKGQTLLLDAVITPDDAEDRQLRWSTSDINVASVENGLVTAIGAGTATITAESMDGSDIKASCTVTVTKREQEFAGTKNYSKTYGDAGFILDAELVEGDGTLEYVSSDSGVAAVSDTRYVTLKGAGEATITVTASETDYYKQAQFKVTIKVSDDKEPTSCSHTYQTTVIPADTRSDGRIVEKCSKCGDEKRKTVIYAVKSVTLSKTSYTYNGKVQKPTVTIKDSKGRILKENTDYTISLPNGMKKPGRYAVTVILKGNYKGTVKTTFDIVPKGTSISKVMAKKKGFTVKWKKQTSQTTGYEIAYSTSRKFTKKNTKKATVKKNKAASRSVSKLKAGKKYYVRIRTYKTVKANGKTVKLYSKWSKVKTVKTKK